MNVKQTIKISGIIDKMGLKINNPKATQEELGADLIMQVISKAHRAEKEIYNLIADIKKITPKEAENVDIVDFIKELTETTGIGDFLKRAVESINQE